MTRREYLARRVRKSVYERQRVAAKRAADPAWWQAYLARNAAYRRERAAVDPEYRHERNIQAK
jgi:hypothetical protein